MSRIRNGAGDVHSMAVSLATISERLGRIEEQITAHAGQGLDHEVRLRAVEKTKWLAVGAAAAAGGLVGHLAGLIG